MTSEMMLPASGVRVGTFVEDFEAEGKAAGVGEVAGEVRSLCLYPEFSSFELFYLYIVSFLCFTEKSEFWLTV